MSERRSREHPASGAQKKNWATSLTRLRITIFDLWAARWSRKFLGPGYAQDDWVRLHGYTAMRWAAIVDFWFSYNQFLAGLVDKIPEARLETGCLIGTHRPVTLRFLIEDYILHMQHHIDQLLRREVVTQYPGATI